MKILIAFITFGLIFFISYLMPLRKNETVTSWVNVEYVNCLSKKLPCDCEKLIDKYISINVDTSLNPNMERISLYGHSQMEPFFYKLNRSNKNKYEILTGKKNPKKLGVIFFNEGFLYLYDQNIKTKYVKIGTSGKFFNYNYSLANVNIINNALKKGGYPSLNTILSEDSLTCECNKWINKGVNMVSVHGKPKAWILEKNQDSLYIYKVINEDSDPGDAIVKRKIYQYNMK